MAIETKEREVKVDSPDRQAVLTNASGFAIERSSQGPTLADELWDEATEGLIATD
ncbi:MAG TPA: hypothetical protein PJ984_01790 [Candidatus Saccharibacteria bacterium]|nr:hypothetical protein [Candidatus Saccharibacteria bacterium]